MRKIYFLLLTILFAAIANAQVDVTATGGTLNASYTTLKGAFDAINAGTHTGTITIGISGNTTETLSAVLNASGSGSASYTSVAISPTGGASRTISGAIAAGSPLIDLNGADNVTINGLNSGGNSLTISNTTASATASTSTIRLINGAQNNTITNCSILGSSTSSITTAGGNILISTSTGGANSGNTISNNNIGPAGANLPTKCILSLGSASPNNNTGNTIDNNNIFDFFNATVGVTGISVSTNTAAITISNNRIYQTAPRVFTGAGLIYAGITGSASTAVFTITGNVIGFAASNGTGVTDISGSTNQVKGLNIPSANTASATSIQNNTISGITQTSSSTAGAGSTAPFIGISVGATAGLFNIGNISGNNIGSLDGSSGIIINNTSVTAGTVAFIGIFDFSFQNLDIINNNKIGTITINNGGSGTTASFYGIYLSGTTGQNVTINNNIIGGTAAGSITDNVVGNTVMYAIRIASANGTVTGNLIRNLVGNSTFASTIVTSAILSLGSTGVNTFSQNTVHSLSNNSGAANNSIYAIYCSFGTAANIVERNFVHSLSITSTAPGAQLVGILPVAGTGTYKNNMVRLGIDASGASITPGYAIYGMFEIAGTNNIYYNSVYIGGTAVVSSSNTFAFVSNVASGARNYIDNIFWNARSNGSGTGKNYAIALSGPGATSNFNDLYATGTGSFVGSFGGDQLTISNWQTATGLDANSFSADPLFLAATGTAATVDLHSNPGVPNVIESSGVNIAGITNDFDNDIRQGNPGYAGTGTAPDIGADEFAGISCRPDFTLTATPSANIICAGSTPVTLTATCTANCGTSQTWSWSPTTGLTPPGGNVSVVSAFPSSTTTYTATLITDVGCGSASKSITVTVAPGAVTGISASASSNTVCVGQTVNLFSSPSSVVGTNFTQNFDGVTAPALPAGWTASNPTNPDGIFWVTTTSTPFSAPNAAFINNPASVSDKLLISPTISILSASPQVTFRNSYDLENGFDGGVLEISINGGAFTDIIAAGGSFVTGGYNGTISSSFSNPLAGRSAWTGNSGGYIITTVNLPAAAIGQTVVLRWRMGSDTSFGNSGWWIDDIQVTSTSVSYTYSWASSPAGFTSTQQNPTGVIVSGTTTYTVTITNTSSGCFSTASTTVTSTSPVISNQTVVQPTTCISNDGSITIVVTGGTGGVGPFTYAWTGSGTGLNPTAQNQTGLSVGTYTVTITDVPSGCQTVQSFALLGPGGCICPTISSLTSNPSANGCINTNITLNATGLANMGTAYGITFKYSTSPLADPYVGGTLIATVPNASLTAGGTAASTTTTFATANTYYIYAVLSPTPPDPACRPSQTVTLPVYGNPSFTSQPVNRTICSGQNTTFAVTTSGTPVTYQWQINQGAGFVNLAEVAPFSGTQTATLTVTGATTVYNGNTFRVILGPCGGATSNVVTLTVNPLPVITVGPDGLCAPVTLIAAGNSNTYSWSPATGLNTTTGSTVIATPAVNTTYTVTGTITATGCQNSATVNVKGNSTAAVLTGTATICNTQTTNLVVTITGGVGPFTVVYNNGTSNVTVNNYNSGANIPVSPSTTTTYTLVSVTGSNGCTGSGINTTPITVTVNPLPTISVSPNNQCSPVTLTATGNSNTYSWSPATGLNQTTGATVTATTTSTITYTVTGTITATGCTNTATATVLGTPLTPVLSPTASNICLGSIVQLNATATPAATWTPVTGLYTDNTATTPYVAGTPLNTVYAKPATTTTYTVVSTSGSCPSPAATITVTVTQPLSITTQPVNTTVCAGSNTTISVVAAGNLLNYQWQVNPGTGFVNLTNTAPYNNVNSATLNINAPTTAINGFQYRVLISNSCSSVTSNAVTLTVNALPVVTATQLTNRICLSDTLVNLVATPIGGVWSGIGVYGNTFIPMRTAVGSYTLTYTYTNSNNCTNRATVVAVVDDCPERIRELGDKGVLLYPNPNDGHFNLRVNSTLYNYLGVRVYTTNGSLVKLLQWSNLQYGRVIPIDLSKLPAAVYQVEVYYDDGVRTAKKTFSVIINH